MGEDNEGDGGRSNREMRGRDEEGWEKIRRREEKD